MSNLSPTQDSYGQPIHKPKIKVSILMNSIFPHRTSLFRKLGKLVNLELLLAGREDNRQWDQAAESHGIKIKYVTGVTIKRYQRDGSGEVADVRYLHLTPGYLKELLSFRPQAVITTEMGARTVIAILYSRIFRKPLWVWWGGTLHTERNRDRFKLCLRKWLFVPLIPNWISYGKTSTAYLTNLGVAPQRILEIQNGVDDNLFKMDVEPINCALPSPVALYVGQLIGRKGFRLFLDAVANLSAEGRRLSILVIGSGPEEGQLTRFRQDNPNIPVEHRRFVPPDEMPSVFRAANFLVFPTLEDVWGVVVNEAILTDTPVISSIYAGCAEELLPPENTFNPLDSDDFRRALISALDGTLSATQKSIVQSQSAAALKIYDAIRHEIEGGR